MVLKKTDRSPRLELVHNMIFEVVCFIADIIAGNETSSLGSQTPGQTVDHTSARVHTRTQPHTS